MQESIAAVIVGSAFWVVAKRYMPKGARRALRVALAYIATELGWRWLAQRFEVERHTAATCGDGCGTCGGCGASGRTTSDKKFAITPDALRRTAHPRKFR